MWHYHPRAGWQPAPPADTLPCLALPRRVHVPPAVRPQRGCAQEHAHGADTPDPQRHDEGGVGVGVGGMAVCVSVVTEWREAELNGTLARGRMDGLQAAQHPLAHPPPAPPCLPACLQVKGHIAKMALCLEDGDERIAALAQLFFHELAKKEYKVGFGVVLEGGVPVRVRA